MTIKFICENNHYDPLTHIAENHIVNRASQYNISIAIYESDAMAMEYGSKQSVPILMEARIEVASNSFNPDVCVKYQSEFFHKLQNFPYTYYLDDEDAKESYLKELIPDAEGLLDLKALQTEPDSKIIRKIMIAVTDEEHQENPAEKARNEMIVHNLINIITAIGNHKAIAQLGSSHCEDLNRYLTKHRPDLLEQVHFFSMHSICTEYTEHPIDWVVSSLNNYFFTDYSDEASLSHFIGVIKRHEEIIMDFWKPHPDPQSIEFEASPHTTRLYISLIGEENSVTPLQAAEIFYNHTKW